METQLKNIAIELQTSISTGCQVETNLLIFSNIVPNLGRSQDAVKKHAQVSQKYQKCVCECGPAVTPQRIQLGASQNRFSPKGGLHF